jgi:glycosyltransferase involved in cell wall biosynthesis
LRQFTAAGHEVELLGSLFNDEFRRLAAKIHEIAPPPWHGLWLVDRFAKRSAQKIPDWDVQAVLGFGRTWAQDIHRAGGGCHAAYAAKLPLHKRLRPKNRWELAVERKLYTGGATQHFVVNAPKVALEIQEHYGVPEENITVIHTGVDLAKYRPIADLEQKMRLRAKIRQEAPEAQILLFASLDHARKGLESALQALKRLPHAVLWIVGAPLDRTWEKRLSELGLTLRVRSFGRQTDLLPYYQAADLFVHPTHYDACANTVLQSMASGLPGIISAADGAHSLIIHGENGWILEDPADTESLAYLIQSALGQDLRPQAEAAHTTMQPLSWAAHLEKWRVLIDQVKG